MSAQGHPRTAGLFSRRTAGIAVGLGAAALLLLYIPIVGLVLLSFSKQALAGIPWPLTLDWYAALTVGEGTRWVEPLGTSVVVGLIVSLASTAVALLIGRAIPTMKRRGGLLGTYLFVIIVPGILIGIAVLIFFRGLLGIRTGLWSVLLVHFSWALPFSLLCILIVAVRFDRRLLDAARDLGAGPVRRFIDVELPLLMPGISASLFFSFLLSFNELPRTLYARGGITTLPYYMWTASSSHSSQVSLVYALSAIITVASFLLTLAAMRLLMRKD
ncbi:MAG TPA: ABC transporter permease subunit [Devosia sp.]|nr:ABC transporter permease subunit [Devosia sp.]